MTIDSANHLDLVAHPLGILAVLIFLAAYGLVIAEERIHLRKSKPVVLAGGIIWALIGIAYASNGMQAEVAAGARHTLLDFAEILLFLIVAITYINTMEERRTFDALRDWLISLGLNFKALFWLTGILAFFISAVADNLTTALIMCAVVMAVGKGNPIFISMSCVNIVVAANAGGAFSPFGDLTTLMVWQKGVVDFWGFFNLFIPSAVNYLVPAAVMHFSLPTGKPDVVAENPVKMKRGARRIMALFALTIATAVTFHHELGLPPVLGMMTGLAFLKFFGFYLRKTHQKVADENGEAVGEIMPFDVFSKIAQLEWDTLLFFYGVVMCVGGLGFMGYLALLSGGMYGTLGPTFANILVGLISAVVDNIPVMFAVLNMNPDMSTGQWLLVTLTAGVGGSLLSIGSAAGVALMGQARGVYTFNSHLRWAPAIAGGYFASILVHRLLNASMF